MPDSTVLCLKQSTWSTESTGYTDSKIARMSQTQRSSTTNLLLTNSVGIYVTIAGAVLLSQANLHSKVMQGCRVALKRRNRRSLQ